MKIQYCTLYMLLIIYASNEYFMLIVSASKGNPDPSRLKKMRDMIRKETSIRYTKERIINNDKNILKSNNALLDKDNKYINNLRSDDNLIELYVRRIDDNISSGPWSYFQHLSMNSLDEDVNRNDMIDSLTNGGIESELIRPKLDYLVSLKVYGKGLGEPLVLDKLKEILPQFKKLKGKQFQFGYKIAETDTFISSLDRNMNNKLQQQSTKYTPSNGIIQESPIQIINITSILENTNPTVDTTINDILEQMNLIDNKAGGILLPSPLELLIHRIDALLEQAMLQNASTILISADGSAAFNGSACIDAAAGVFAMPIAQRSQITIPNLKTNSSSSSSDIIITNDIIIDNESTMVINNNEDIKAAAPRSFSNTHPTSTGGELFSGNISNAIYLSVFDFKGMISTPFDAELAAGLAAVTLAHVIFKRFTLKRSLSSTIPMMKFQILTDSRSFLRTLRKDFSDDLLFRSMTNRFALWTCIMKHYEELSTTTTSNSSSSTITSNNSNNSKDESIFKTEWFPGHPERRDLHVETWSVKDKAIWIADELARGKTRLRHHLNDDIAQKLYSKDGLQMNREIVIDLKAIELLSISKVLLKK